MREYVCVCTLVCVCARARARARVCVCMSVFVCDIEHLCKSQLQLRQRVFPDPLRDYTVVKSPKSTPHHLSHLQKKS
jgi:hypothetical protein